MELILCLYHVILQIKSDLGLKYKIKVSEARIQTFCLSASGFYRLLTLLVDEHNSISRKLLLFVV